MTSKRLHFILIAAIGLAFVGLVALTYGVNYLLSEESKKLVDYKAKSRALDQQQVSLKSATRDIERYSELEKIAKTIVPEDKNQASAVREIVDIAGANGIALGSITFPASTLGGSATGGSTQKPGSTGAPQSNTNSKTTDLSQLQPVKNIPGVYQLTITITGDDNSPVQYSKFVNFLSGLERNRRTAQVTTVALQPDANNPNLLTFMITINQFIKP